MRISDWSSDVCSSDLAEGAAVQLRRAYLDQAQDALLDGPFLSANVSSVSFCVSAGTWRMCSMRSDMSYNSTVLRMTQALAFMGTRHGAPSRLKAFIDATAIVRQTSERGSTPAHTAA